MAVRSKLPDFLPEGGIAANRVTWKLFRQHHGQRAAKLTFSGQFHCVPASAPENCKLKLSCGPKMRFVAVPAS